MRQALDGRTVMNISTETREILRNYKTVINARRREMGRNRSPPRRLLMKSAIL
ncbi:plasmid protein [Escherichia coli]|uniref:Plasmid protein n=1 Tax=Escherichia coli TaxID=562 RepID=A0A376ZSV7_ECOLX|nr:plasmid protein [Escherichia coli]